MSRPNKCIKGEDGKEYWISRPAVVLAVVFKLDDETGKIYTLVERRGPAVSHTGEWCIPGGYLDWDENVKQACQREVVEETGLQLDLDNIIFVNVNTEPDSKPQTLDFWHMCWAKKDDNFDFSKIKTIQEILDLKWMKVAKVYKKGLFRNKFVMDIYKKTIYDGYGTWAFKSHKDKIIEMLTMMVKGGKVHVLDE